MKDGLSAKTEIVSYFLWEYTEHTNALNLWYCAEDIGFFLEGRKIIERSHIQNIISLSKEDADYIEFVRQIAYRIHFFTSGNDDIKNWFAAERLLRNGEWLDAVLVVSELYSKLREGNYEIAGSIRSEKFRKLFN